MSTFDQSYRVVVQLSMIKTIHELNGYFGSHFSQAALDAGSPRRQRLNSACPSSLFQKQLGKSSSPTRVFNLVVSHRLSSTYCCYQYNKLNDRSILRPNHKLTKAVVDENRRPVPDKPRFVIIFHRGQSLFKQFSLRYMSWKRRIFIPVRFYSQSNVEQMLFGGVPTLPLGWHTTSERQDRFLFYSKLFVFLVVTIFFPSIIRRIQILKWTLAVDLNSFDCQFRDEKNAGKEPISVRDDVWNRQINRPHPE
jgi:hypothetical protein